MPTFNQLVRKGREQATYKSNSPAMQYSLNTLKNKENTLYKGGDKGRAFAIIYSLSIHQSLRLPFSLRPLRG